jgi:hypothetical protein
LALDRTAITRPQLRIGTGSELPDLPRLPNIAEIVLLLTELVFTRQCLAILAILRVGKTATSVPILICPITKLPNYQISTR